MKDLAPVVLFVYNRPFHTMQTLAALENNTFADQSILFVFSDGPKVDASEDDLNKIIEVRKLIKSKMWCKEVHLIERDSNLGLAVNIIQGVTEVVNKYGKVIVLEDDIVTSSYFLKYMNATLIEYEKLEKVMHITGHSFPLLNIKEDTYFLKYVSPWGWGTWRDRWMKFENNSKELLRKLHIMKDFSLEDYNSRYGNAFYEQLLANIDGKLNTWAVKWHTSIYLNNGLCLFPRNSLVRNIGFDNSGENCGDLEPVFSEISNSMPVITSLSLKVNQIALLSFGEYYNNLIKPEIKNSLIKKIYGRFQSIFMGKK